MGKIKLEELYSDLMTWGEANIWSLNTMYQLIILLIAFAFGAITFHTIRARLEGRIDAFKIPIRIKKLFKDMMRLTAPIITIIVIYLITLIAVSETIGIDVRFLIVMMKILTAWVIIRFALMFIGNKLIRNFFAVIILMIAALSIIDVLEPTMGALDAFGFNLGDFRISALTVIQGAFSLFFLLYLALFASTFAERQVLRTKSLTRSSQVLIAKIIRVLLIVLAVIVAITSAGIDLSIFAVLSGAIGLGIGFGLQKVVSNLFSGMLLLMDKSIQPGDVIELEASGTFGWVSHMGARYTEIITRDNKSYLIPNEEFVTQAVVNWSHGNDRLVRISVEFGASYNADPHQVLALAKEAAKVPERVAEAPEPVCWITEFGDSSVNFTLRFWIKDAESGVANIKGEVLLALWDALKENDVEIPFPQRVVHMAKD